jgi:glutathione S-transferase
MPAIYDPNRDLTLWESGAIIEYLIEVYDQDQKLSFPAGSKEAYLAKQWLYFQVSGQGPYFGQVSAFRDGRQKPAADAIPRLSGS